MLLLSNSPGKTNLKSEHPKIFTAFKVREDSRTDCGKPKILMRFFNFVPTKSYFTSFANFQIKISIPNFIILPDDHSMISIIIAQLSYSSELHTHKY